MLQELSVQRLSAGSVYKVIGLGTLFFMVPFGVLMGLFALFGAATVHWKQESVTGLTGFLLGPVVGLSASLFFTVFLGTVCNVGLWLYSKAGAFKLQYLCLPAKDAPAAD
jgi:hypothetical protein